MIYGQGYDTHWEVLDMAASLGILDKSGNWYKYNDENIANGEVNAVAFLKENKDIYDEVREETMIQIGLKEIYEQHGQQGPIYS